MHGIIGQECGPEGKRLTIVRTEFFQFANSNRSTWVLFNTPLNATKGMPKKDKMGLISTLLPCCNVGKQIEQAFCSYADGVVWVAVWIERRVRGLNNHHVIDSIYLNALLYCNVSLSDNWPCHPVWQKSCMCTPCRHIAYMFWMQIDLVYFINRMKRFNILNVHIRRLVSQTLRVIIRLKCWLLLLHS